MPVIPCTQCPDCGLWNQFSVTQCECGADLRKCKVIPTEITRLSPLEYGVIDQNAAAYVQRCGKCRGIAYTTSPKRRHSTCPHCGSDVIARFRPIYYLDLPQD